MKTNQPQKNIWLQCDVEQLVNEGVLFKPLDGNHGGIHPKASDFVSEGIPFVMASDIYDSKVDLNKSNFITKKQADNLQKGFSLEGDVLFTHKGSVGGTAIVPSINTEYIMLTPQVTYYRVKNKERLNNHFIFYYFQSSKFQAYVKSVSGGGTRAYIGITAQLSLPFILPPLNEQNRIVSVLETWDKAIEKLSKKIEVKKQIKKGLMQGLLTGKKRLKGFSDKWKDVILDDVMNSFSTGLNPRDNFKLGFGKNYYVTIKNISNGHLDFSNAEMVDDIALKLINKRSKLSKNDIIMSSIGNVGESYLLQEDPKGWDINESVFCLKPNVKIINPKFLYFTIISSETKKYFENNITGSSFRSIKMKELKNMPITIPEINEQNAVAEILTTAEDEIQELEKKLQIIKEQKKYLLNNLITGTIRTPETLSTKLTK